MWNFQVLSSEWILLCLARFLLWLNDFSHLKASVNTEYFYIYICQNNLPASENVFSQISHSKGFSSVCVLVCLLKSVLFLKDFSHIITWIRLFTSMNLLYKKKIHTTHKNGVLPSIFLHSSYLFLKFVFYNFN